MSSNGPAVKSVDSSMQAAAGGPAQANLTASPAEGLGSKSSSSAAPGYSAPESGTGTSGSGNAFASGSSGPSLPPVTLPSGGGSIRGMGENISMNAVQGTASTSIPLDLSPCRNGAQPQLSLQYDSGGGNSVWGIGWNLNGVVDITRRTRLGLPKYEDGEREDIFLISGAEDLVPVYMKDAQGDIKTTTNPQNGELSYTLNETLMSGFHVRQYRPRIDSLYSRIERWTDQLDPENIHWRIISTANEITVLGRDENSRIMSDDGARIFSWLCCEWYDCLGNARSYEYKIENGDNVDLAQANEANRTEVTRNTQRHLKRIKYGNRTPIMDRTGINSAAAILTPNDWMFEVVFDYGEHDPVDPQTQDTKRMWTCRKDPFSSFMSGFEVRTYRLCQRILMFHHFPNELGRQDYLVKAWEIEYEEGLSITYSKKIQRAGFVVRGPDDPQPQDADRGSPYYVKRLPPLALEYTKQLTGDELQQLTLQDVQPGSGLENLPDGVQGPYQWVDLLGEGTNGILFSDSSSWYYQRNLSAMTQSLSLDIATNPFESGARAAKKPKFGPFEIVATQPSLREYGQFLDLGGDGQLNFAYMQGPNPGFYQSTSDPEVAASSKEGFWKDFRPFRSWPTLDIGDPNIRLIDITGDGKADILISQDSIFIWYESLGEDGFAAAKTVPAGLDEEQTPRILFSDQTEAIHLADFNGDGLIDIVRVRNGDLCYWPNMGYGKFGKKVSMDNAPWFDHVDAFTFRRLVLGDIDGFGTTDLIYFKDGGACVYYNQAGNGWSDPIIIDFLGDLDSFTTVAAVDLLSSGTMCLVWSSSSTSSTPGQSMKYLDLSPDGQKPHLLSRIVNNMGGETRFVYRSSTAYYLDDLAAGTPWATRLPFPQYCVDGVVTYDKVSKTTFSQRYKYHHGYYDAVEREFRGFGMVEQWDTEQFEFLTGPAGAVNQARETHVPPAHTKSWFHTGAFEDHERLSRAYAKEYFLAPKSNATAFQNFFAAQLRDEVQIDFVAASASDFREASRAFKGSLLRSETYGDDGLAKSVIPYQIQDLGNSVRMIQPRGNQNKYAVFQKFVRENVTSYLERSPTDARTQHSVTLNIDAFGNVLESSSISYGRQLSQNLDPDLEATDTKKQRQLQVTYSRNEYTNLVDEGDNYRVPQLCKVRQWEAPNIFPVQAASGRILPASLLQLKNMAEISFGEKSDPAVPAKRLLANTVTQYLADDLAGLLPYGQQQSLGLPGATYTLCLDASMLSGFQRDGASLISDSADLLPTKGGYVDYQGDGQWWIPSPRQFYHQSINATPAESLLMAKSSFFTPQRVQDSFGSNTLMTPDAHVLAYVFIQDQIGNISTGVLDYRVLQLQVITDPNGNRTQAVRDALGITVGLAIMGKEDESLGDTLEGFRPNLSNEEISMYFEDPIQASTSVLAGATSRFLYDTGSYQTKGAGFPICASAITREIPYHEQLPASSDTLIEETKTQIMISYTDGHHREIQLKQLAEPDTTNPTLPRWRVTGWTVFNNKGNPVRVFEPSFDSSQEFVFDNRHGVSSITIYDPLSRPVGVLYPNGTWGKQVNHAWSTEQWDANDTILQNIKDDPDLGPYVQYLPADILGISWNEARKNGQMGSLEKAAASKTLGHAKTPSIMHLDSMGRQILFVKDNGANGKISNRVSYNVKGDVLETLDGLDRVITSSQYNMCSGIIGSQSADSGSVWVLTAIDGQSLYRWDQRGFRFRIEYDVLRRTTDIYSERKGKESLILKKVYGEGQPDSQAKNYRGKLFQEYDQAGIVSHSEWDYKGKELLRTRQFAVEYKLVLDWSDILTVKLEPDIHKTRHAYDALGRVIQMTSPDNSVVNSVFNRGGLLQSITTSLKGGAQVSSMVTSMEYDAYGRVVKQTAGNNTVTTNSYDPLTKKLRNRTVVLQQGGSRTVIQDLSYTYDPSGNVTYIKNAAEQTVFFRNGPVSPDSEYTYDAAYRLIEATGREDVGQTNGAPSGPDVSTSAASSSTTTQFGDGSAMVRYVENYVYDNSGCMISLRHQFADPKFPGWTRNFAYNDAEGKRANNRLTSTTVGNNISNYTYDVNGNMTSMPSLPKIRWDCSNEMRSSSQQKVTDGTPETTWYVYNGSGARVRKVTDRYTPANAPAGPAKMSERLIIDGYEVYRQYAGDSVTVTRQCETVIIPALDGPIAVIEDWSGGNDDFRLIRFQMQDLLHSITVELDENGKLLSYEEYTPYGSTSYQSSPSKSPKRYRFAGKERDTESGLSYFGQRYYVPWLARWMNPDPTGIADGLNVFEYVASNPIFYVDPTGTCKEDPPEENPQNLNVKGRQSPELKRGAEEDRERGLEEPEPKKRAIATKEEETYQGGQNDYENYYQNDYQYYNQDYNQYYNQDYDQAYNQDDHQSDVGQQDENRLPVNLVRANLPPGTPQAPVMTYRQVLEFKDEVSEQVLRNFAQDGFDAMVYMAYEAEGTEESTPEQPDVMTVLYVKGKGAILSSSLKGKRGRIPTDTEGLLDGFDHRSGMCGEFGAVAQALALGWTDGNGWWDSDDGAWMGSVNKDSHEHPTGVLPCSARNGIDGCEQFMAEDRWNIQTLWKYWGG